MTQRQDPSGGLMARLERGPVVCGEGYHFELERRGYVQAGAFVPTVVLEHPEAVEHLHREYVRAGSDVVEAFTYYAHRAKLKVVGKEDVLEPMQRQALEIAKRVARESDALFAGNVCNTTVYEPDRPDTHAEAQQMFAEQIDWIAEAGADFVIAETLSHVGEAMLALEAIQAAGLDAVVTLAIWREPKTFDGVPLGDAVARLEQAGAAVVGLNCIRGPATMLELLPEVRDAVSCPVAALPVAYRCTAAEPTMVSLTDELYPAERLPAGRPFPTALDPKQCNRYEIADFARDAYALGVRYQGLCCGGAPHFLRSMAEALGHDTEASRYSPDISKHAFLTATGQTRNLQQA